MKHDLSVGALGWCALALLGSVLPWGTVHLSPRLGALPAGNLRASPVSVALPVNGFRGDLALGAVHLPNGLVPVAALAIAILVLWRASRRCDSLRAAGFRLLALYGLLHVTVLLLVLARNAGQIGPGLLVTVVAFAGLLGLPVSDAEAMARQPRHDRSNLMA